MTLSDIMDRKNRKGKQLGDFTCNIICGLVIKTKWKQVEISKEFDIPTSIVNRVVINYRKYSWKIAQFHSGRPKKTHPSRHACS
jgi:hypothetical protein